MKKYSSILTLVFLFSIASTFAQTRETRNVGPFTKIAFRVPGKLYLKQGSTTKVEIEGKKDIIKEIDTEVQGSRLVIGKDGKWMDWSWDNDDQVTVYVTIKDLQGVSVSGSGDLIGEGKFTTGNLTLDVSGSGSLKIDVDASGNIEADVSGSGDMSLTGKCEDFSSDVSGSGSIELAMTIHDEADFEVTGSGKTRASGTANIAKASISGSGKVLAAELVVNRCDVHITGSGDVEIHVKEALDANISGSGTVLYKGNPSKVNSDASGSGKVSKM